MEAETAQLTETHLTVYTWVLLKLLIIEYSAVSKHAMNLQYIWFTWAVILSTYQWNEHSVPLT